MFCENGNTVLRIEPVYGSMQPRALHSRCTRAPLQEDIRSRLDVARQLMAANGALASQHQGFLPKAIGPLLRRTEFTNDAYGRVTKTTDPAGYTYDANNQKIGETVNYGTFQKSLAYTYTANGLKASFTAPDGTVVRYGYDTNNQLNSVQLPIGTIVTNRFDWTAPTKWTFPGGVIQERQYDPLLRPTGIRVKDQASNAWPSDPSTETSLCK